MSWIGLTLDDNDQWALDSAGFHLYDGLPGIILFLAYLGAVTREDRYTALALAATATLRGKIEALLSSPMPIGAFHGWGGVVYTFTHLGVLWDQPDLLDEANRLVERLPMLVEQDERFDIISGAAGCIGGLLCLYSCAPSEQIRAAVVKCGAHLVERAICMEQGVGWVSKGTARLPLAGFSHGAAGIAWALLEAAALTGEARFRSTALAAMAHERSLFCPAQGNWRDLREFDVSGQTPNRDGETFMTMWCHGAPGIGLARLLSLRHVDDAAIRAEIAAALRTTRKHGFGRTHSLCHGDLGNLELFLHAGRVLARPRWGHEALRVGSMVLENIATGGWRCGTPQAIESPGLMTGLAGIGYQLLRLADPTRVPAVLTLAPPL